MPPRPSVVVFDVNETLSDMRPLARAFEEVGAPAELLDSWFAAVLRDGFALTIGGAFTDFRALALANLGRLLPRYGVAAGEAGRAAEHVLAAFLDLDVHGDVPAGLRRLHEAGATLVTMTNGSVEITERLLRKAGLLELFAHRLDVTAVGRWKPAPEPYLHAAHTAGASPAEAALVAVHPWDTDGAQRAGLTGAWLNREGAPWPEPFQSPHVFAPDLETLAARLLAL